MSRLHDFSRKHIARGVYRCGVIRTKRYLTFPRTICANYVLSVSCIRTSALRLGLRRASTVALPDKLDAYVQPTSDISCDHLSCDQPTTSSNGRIVLPHAKHEGQTTEPHDVLQLQCKSKEMEEAKVATYSVKSSETPGDHCQSQATTFCFVDDEAKVTEPQNAKRKVVKGEGSPVDHATEALSQPELPLTHPSNPSAQGSIIYDIAPQFHHTADYTVYRPKIDLSYTNVREREMSAAVEGQVPSLPTKSTKFRGNAGMRFLLSRYMQHIEPLFQVRDGRLHSEAMFDHLLLAFYDESASVLRARGYDFEDIISWSWVFEAVSGDRCVQRYVCLSQQTRSFNEEKLPIFIPLQLLRSERITAQNLDLLLQELEISVQGGTVWDKDSAPVLLIRLLRHARIVDASQYERIVELSLRILPLGNSANNHEQAQRLTHFYNRFLSLIALPVARSPFNSVDIQQRSQLRIARSMMEALQPLPMTREGYRALARVQLMHKKTVQEQQWSSVKAPSWPPWRRDELGIDAKNEYPGHQSRVSKVIKRLLEAGYGPESVEHEAQILAGWDTDKSPTIQVRRVPHRRPLSWIRNILKDKEPPEPEPDHYLWAARVAATRSVREAWICFYSYTQASVKQRRHLRVYHEMFHKMFARVQSSDQRAVPSPGDGREVFADPVSSRDLTYAPKEPPSIEELYAQMLQDSIKPAGRLLASLMDNAQSLQQGLDYINQSSLGDVKKDVLLHPEKYPRHHISGVYQTIPDYLLASYLGLLAMGEFSAGVQLLWPGSRSTEEHGSLPLTQAKPLHYSMTLLQVWKPTYMPAYHAVLEGIYVQTKSKNRRCHTYSELYKLTKQVLHMLEQQMLSTDLTCFRKVVLIVRNIMIRAPRDFATDLRSFESAVPYIKNIFVKALHGHFQGGRLALPCKAREASQQPYWKDIEALVLFLGFGNDFQSIIDLTKWFHDAGQDLECVSGGGYKVQRLACGLRFALDQRWSKESVGASDGQVAEVKNNLPDWNWPETIDLEEYARHHVSWFEGMRTVIKYSALAGSGKSYVHLEALDNAM